MSNVADTLRELLDGEDDRTIEELRANEPSYSFTVAKIDSAKRETVGTAVELLAGGAGFGVAVCAVLAGAGAVSLIPAAVGAAGAWSGIESLRYLLDEARYQGRRDGFHEARHRDTLRRKQEGVA